MGKRIPVERSKIPPQGTKKHQRRGRLFVDARETTIYHIGELEIAIEREVIGKDDVVADLYDLAGGFASAD